MYLKLLIAVGTVSLLIGSIYLINNLNKTYSEPEEKIIYGEFNENKDIVYAPIECLFEKENKLYYNEDCK